MDDDLSTKRLIESAHDWTQRANRLRQRAICGLELCMTVFEEALRSPSLSLEDRVEIAGALADVLYSVQGEDGDDY